MADSLAAPPRQARSRATLERYVSAARRLMEDRTWESVTVQELARAADSSVGAFYARFGDKQGLLDYLDEQYTREMTEFRDWFVRDARARKLGLRSLVRQFFGTMVRFHRQRRGLLRTLVLETRGRRAPGFDGHSRRMDADLPAILGLFEEYEKEIDHPEPERAFFCALSFTFSAMRDRILFPESMPASFELCDRELTEELVRACLRHLGRGDLL